MGSSPDSDRERIENRELGAGSREQRAGRALRWNADLLCKYADCVDFR